MAGAVRRLGEGEPGAGRAARPDRERRLPEGWAATLPTLPADAKGVATRKASGKALAALYPELPELWGGSADLAESNNTAVEGEPSFLPANRQTKMWSGGPYGRTLHFGVREHAMGAIMNGIALHGGTRVYGGTFLIFSDYMRGAVRLAALMQLPVTYVWTHDSIGLGEDGPTHQPIEHLAALRAIPGLDVVRPADANEVSVAWRTILEHNDRPAGLLLSRQNLPVFDRERFGSAEGAARGGYVLADASSGNPEVILMGTGSEVQIAMAAREPLEADGVATRVVSMPCVEWFADQDQAYKDQVLPPPSAPASASRPVCRWAGASSSVTPAGSWASPLRRQRRVHRALRAVRPHRRGRGGRGPREHRGSRLRERRPGRPGCSHRGPPPPHRRPLRPRTAPRKASDMAQNENLASCPEPGWPSGWTTCPATGSAAATCSRWSTSTASSA